MAVAAVDELVRATGKATLGCVLTSREPREKSRDIKIPTAPGNVSMRGASTSRDSSGTEASRIERHTWGLSDAGGPGSRGILERRRRTPRGPRRPALPTRLPRTFGLDMGDRQAGDDRGGSGARDLHSRTHSPRPPKSPVWPAAHAGESGDRLSGMLSSEMMTAAQ